MTRRSAQHQDVEDCRTDDGPEGASSASSEPERFDGYRFSTGHRVVFIRSGDGEEVQVRSAEGAVQVRIVLTPAGPVISLQQAELEIASLGTVRTRCQRFELEANEGARIASGSGLELSTEGEMRLEATGELVAVAELIRLN